MSGKIIVCTIEQEHYPLLAFQGRATSEILFSIRVNFVLIWFKTNISPAVSFKYKCFG